ncbi:MAG: DUF1127 domain-containing protein [Alphaproteobacteria bacterium]|nr:DUF1127 domain-containing protein [Alphaproteobacteria bacterium]
MRKHINISHNFSDFWVAAETAGNGIGRFPAPRTAAVTFDLSRAKQTVAARIETAVATVFLWMERARERRALAQLDGRLLSDIGVGHAEAAHEAAKPFWRA